VKSGIVMRSDADPATVVLSASNIDVIADFTGTGAGTLIENLTFAYGVGAYVSLGSEKYPVLCVDSEAVFRNCIFRDSHSPNDGAGFYCKNASPTLIDCVFENNHAFNGAGGGFVSRRADPVLINCVFRNNTAHSYGGGVYVVGSDSNPIFQKCVFEGNEARFGGGMTISGMNLTIAGCDIRGNVATDNGGGLYLLGEPAVTIHTSVIFANGAEQGKSIYGTRYALVELYCGEVDALGFGGGVEPVFHFEGCREVSNREASWGEIKTLYR